MHPCQRAHTERFVLCVFCMNVGSMTSLNRNRLASTPAGVAESKAQGVANKSERSGWASLENQDVAFKRGVTGLLACSWLTHFVSTGTEAVTTATRPAASPWVPPRADKLLASRRQDTEAITPVLTCKKTLAQRSYRGKNVTYTCGGWWV
jgi:hypothetical protein